MSSWHFCFSSYFYVTPQCVEGAESQKVLIEKFDFSNKQKKIASRRLTRFAVLSFLPSLTARNRQKTNNIKVKNFAQTVVYNAIHKTIYTISENIYLCKKCRNMATFTFLSYVCDLSRVFKMYRLNVFHRFFTYGSFVFICFTKREVPQLQRAIKKNTFDFLKILVKHSTLYCPVFSLKTCCIILSLSEIQHFEMQEFGYFDIFNLYWFAVIS